MTVKEAIDCLLEILKLMASWPVVIFLVFLALKEELRELLSEFTKQLSKRLKKATIAGSSFEFADAENQAIKDTIEEHSKNHPEEVPEFVMQLMQKAVPSTHPPKKDLPLAGKSILWVDDNPHNNVYETNLLKRLGARITQVKTTDEALETRHNNTFNLIISDIHRRENGKELPTAGYNLITKNELIEPYIPIVLYTGNASRVDPIASAPACGVADNSRDLVDIVLKTIAHEK